MEALFDVSSATAIFFLVLHLLTHEVPVLLAVFAPSVVKKLIKKFRKG